MADAFRANGLEMPRIAVTTTTAHLLFQLLESGRFVGHFGDGLLHFYADRFALKRLPIDASDSAVRSRNHCAEEPDHQPGGAAFHRLRARGRKAVSEATIGRNAAGRNEKASAVNVRDMPLDEFLATEFPDQSSLVPENFSTLAHLSVSISTKLANGAGP